MRRERVEHPERVKARDRARYYRDWEKRRAAADAYADAHPEAVTAAKKRWDARNPEKRKAQHAVSNAIRDGRLTRGLTCERASEGSCHGRIHAHHDDYTKPLDVRWLCAGHHGMEHRK